MMLSHGMVHFLKIDFLKTNLPKLSCGFNISPGGGAVLAQWIRLQALNGEVPGSNLLAAAEVPLGKALYPHCLVPWNGLKNCWSPGCLLKGNLEYW